MLRIIRRKDLTTTQWSGGTTTQLAIYPEAASYAERNFVWRVSTARVDAERSDFTSLPGVSRILMVLDGALRLEHAGRHEARLERFGQDSFSGDWNTVSYGRATDFNLMITEGEGSVRAVRIAPGGEVPIIPAEPKKEWAVVSEVFYFISEGISMNAAGMVVGIEIGDVAVSTMEHGASGSSLKLINSATNEAYIIHCVIYHNI